MPDPDMTGPHNAAVQQAVGMISVQAKCSIAEAFDLLRERAFALDRPVESVAQDVVDRVLRFSS